MTDDLRTRIAAVVYQHTLFRALDQCECGAAFDGFCGRSLDAWAAHVADAVIAELGLEVDLTYLSDDKTRKFFELRGFYQTDWKDDDE